MAFATETAQRCLDQDIVLVVQDTTTLNFTGLHSIPELGPIDSGGLARGVHLHTALGRDHLGTGHRHLGPAVLGAAPAGPAGPRGERERQVDQRHRCVPAPCCTRRPGTRPVPRLIHVMDREGDAYEVMMTVEDAGDSAIIRCAQNRRIDDPLAKAHEAVRSQPVLCRDDRAEVSRKAGVPERRAAVEVRSMRVTLVPDLAEVPARLADDLEPGGGMGARATGWDRAGALAALDARAGGDGGRGAGGGAEIHVPVADRGGALGAQERLPRWRLCGWRPGTDWRRP